MQSVFVLLWQPFNALKKITHIQHKMIYLVITLLILCFFFHIYRMLSWRIERQILTFLVKKKEKCTIRIKHPILVRLLDESYLWVKKFNSLGFYSTTQIVNVVNVYTILLNDWTEHTFSFINIPLTKSSWFFKLSTCVCNSTFRSVKIKCKIWSLTFDLIALRQWHIKQTKKQNNNITLQIFSYMYSLEKKISIHYLFLPILLL